LQTIKMGGHRANGPAPAPGGEVLMQFDPNQPIELATERLSSMFDAAMAFGLSREQVWQAVLEVVERTPLDKPVGECLDDVAAALAARIGEA
jgi:hypothetical protein